MAQSRKYDGADVRTILIAMVTNQTVCSRIASRWPQEGLFDSSWANLVGGWCVDHQRKFNTPPADRITARFQKWADNSANDESVISAIENFLRALSDQHDHADRNGDAPDDQYLIDLAARYFNRVRVKAAHKQAQVEIENGRHEEAYQRMINIRKVELGSGAIHRPADDFADWDRAFQEDRRRPLITYPDAVGEFIGDSFVRGELYAFQGPDKTGKSSILRDITYRACRARRRVAFFDTGDGNYEEFLLYLGCRVTEAAEFSHLTAFPVGFDDEGKLQTHERRISQANPIDAFRRFRKICRSPDLLRVECHPNSTLSIAGIDSILGEWERDGWRADVVCIAEGSLVLTSRGCVPIEDVRLTDKLWDGIQWVSHDGVVYKGERDVIQYGGLTATPDHQVWTDHGWRTIESCRKLGLRVAKTGDGGQSLWLGRDYFSCGQSSCGQLQLQEVVCASSLYAMWQREVDVEGQSHTWCSQRVSDLLAAKAISYMVVAAIGEREAEVSESQVNLLQTLWSTWDSIQVQYGVGSLFVGDRQSWFGGQVDGIRQDRERWALRARQSSLVYAQTKYRTHTQASDYSCCAQVPFVVSRNQVCRCYTSQDAKQRYDTEYDRNSLGIYSPQVRKSRRVWDIRNAGPFHRFTVQGVLAHNCIDYADILAPPEGVTDTLQQIDQTWRGMRRLSQERNCLVVTATQSNSAAYGNDKKLLSRKHFSGRKTKNAEVNGMIGINVSEDERKQQIARWNWVVRRKDRRKGAVVVAGCFDIGNPVICSRW